MWKVALEVYAAYGVALAIAGYGIFAYVTMIITIIKNWRTLND